MKAVSGQSSAFEIAVGTRSRHKVKHMAATVMRVPPPIEMTVRLNKPEPDLRSAGTLDGVGQANGLEHPDEIPADVGLIPAEAKARGTGMRVMVFVPVLTPGGQLERAKPPDVHAGIAFFDLLQVREAVYETLHVKRVDEADRAHPKEAHPAETENQANAD